MLPRISARRDLRALGKNSGTGDPGSASGEYCMQHGIQLNLTGDFQSAAFVLVATGDSAPTP
jgi:hypothetical protein